MILNYTFYSIFELILNIYRAKDKEAEEKRREVDRLYSESLALEAAKDELRRKEEERAKKKLNS